MLPRLFATTKIRRCYHRFWLRHQWRRLRKTTDPDFGENSIRQQSLFLTAFDKYQQLERTLDRQPKKVLSFRREVIQVNGWIYDEDPDAEIFGIASNRRMEIRKRAKKYERTDLDIAFPEWDVSRKAFKVTVPGSLKALLLVSFNHESSVVKLRVANELKLNEKVKRLLSGVTDLQCGEDYVLGYIDDVKILSAWTVPHLVRTGEMTQSPIIRQSPVIRRGNSIDVKDLKIAESLGISSLSERIQAHLESRGYVLPIEFSDVDADWAEGEPIDGWKFFRPQLLTEKAEKQSQSQYHSTEVIQGLKIHHGCLLAKDQTLFVADRAMNPRLAFASGSHTYLKGRYSYIDRCWMRVDPTAEVVSLTGDYFLALHRNAANFYHAMIEVLPLIVSAQNRALSKRVLINHELPGTFKSLLYSIFEDLEFLEIKNKTTYSIESAEVPLNRTVIYDSFDEPISDACQISREDIALLRSIHELNAAGGDGTLKRKLFITRHGARSITNHRNVEKLLNKDGFITYLPETNSLEAQIMTVKRAERIVGVGGAALSLLVFAEADKILIFQPPGFSGFTGFSGLCEDLSDVTIISEKKSKGRQIEHLHKNYKVPLRKLRKHGFSEV